MRRLFWWTLVVGVAALPVVVVVGLPLGGEIHRLIGGDGTIIAVEAGYETEDWDDLVTTVGERKGTVGELSLPDSKSFPRTTFLGAQWDEARRQPGGKYVITGTLVFRQRARKE